jgi:hypothetical protein
MLTTMSYTSLIASAYIVAFVCTHLHYFMHIDPANEGPTQEQPLIEEPNNELHQEQEDGVSLIKSVPASRGCLGQSLTTRQTNLA